MSSKFHLGILTLTAALVLAPPPLAAQTMTNTFGGLSENSNEPIDIESDLLVVHDKQKYATFSGNVKAVQGTTTLRAKELVVHYVGGDKLAPGEKKDEVQAPAETKVADAQGAPAPAPVAGKAGDGTKPNQGDTQITKIEAKGDVIINSKDDQTTTSDWAVYDLPTQSGHRRRQCGVNPRQECAKGGPARHRSDDGREPVRQHGQYRRRRPYPRAVHAEEGWRRRMPSRATPNPAEPSRAMRSLAARRPSTRRRPARSLTRTQATRPRRMIAGTPRIRSSRRCARSHSELRGMLTGRRFN